MCGVSLSWVDSTNPYVLLRNIADKCYSYNQEFDRYDPYKYISPLLSQHPDVLHHIHFSFILNTHLNLYYIFKDISDINVSLLRGVWIVTISGYPLYSEHNEIIEEFRCMAHNLYLKHLSGCDFIHTSFEGHNTSILYIKDLTHIPVYIDVDDSELSRTLRCHSYRTAMINTVDSHNFASELSVSKYSLGTSYGFFATGNLDSWDAVYHNPSTSILYQNLIKSTIE